MRVSMAVQRQTFSTCINRNPNIFYKRYPSSYLINTYKKDLSNRPTYSSFSTLEANELENYKG